MREPGQGTAAALIYQHEARGADKRITDATDSHVQAERGRDDEDGTAGTLVPQANCTEDQQRRRTDEDTCSETAPELGLYVGAGDGNRTRTISLGS
jgi:hypothetical protein